MASVTQQEVAPLHKQIDVTINKEDYLPSFERALKDYSKKANIPGFRKGMVPPGLIKKMYGNSLFADEVLRTVDKEVINYIQSEKLDIFAQPLPKEFNLAQLDVNKPDNYTFSFEVGMKPEFSLPDFLQLKIKRYKIDITEEMVDVEVERLCSRHGNMSEPESVTGDHNVLNVLFTETDKDGNDAEGGNKKDNSLLVKYFKESFRPSLIGKKGGDEMQLQLDEAFEGKELEWILNDLGMDSASGRHFKLSISKVGLVEKRDLNEEFYNQLFPDGSVNTGEEFINAIKQQLQDQWDTESRNQLHHQLYHLLFEDTQIDFPREFLKRWIKTQGQDAKQKTDEQVEHEFPEFLNQLKWTLITGKIISENNIKVEEDEIRQFAKQQLLGYMGLEALDEEQQWVRDYIDRMMKDRKYAEDAYAGIQTQKMFEWTEMQINAIVTNVSKEEFIRMNETHKHEHNE